MAWKIPRLEPKWLYERKAKVTVGGKFSSMKIHNMVYQGTVLGPPLWNVY